MPPESSSTASKIAEETLSDVAVNDTTVISANEPQRMPFGEQSDFPNADDELDIAISFAE